MTFLPKIRKALIALAVAGGGALITALGDSSPGGASITSAEWLAGLGLALAAAGAVFLVPNAPTDGLRRRIIAEEQTRATGPWASAPGGQTPPPPTFRPGPRHGGPDRY